MTKKINKPTASTVLKYSPQKARLIINAIRGMTLKEAQTALLMMKKAQTKNIDDLLKTAINNNGLEESSFDKVFISKIVAEEAQKYYRVQPRARGSAFRIRRRYSRIKLWIEEKTLTKTEKSRQN